MIISFAKPSLLEKLGLDNAMNNDYNGESRYTHSYGIAIYVKKQLLVLTLVLLYDYPTG